jgi:putative ribosome biogenesis GTPase RsgA
MNGIHKIWLKDENRRIYQDDKGNKTSTPNERHYWVECEVVSETSRSYIVKYRGETKVPKNRELIVGDWVAFSQEEVDAKVFKATHAYKIAEKVRSLDAMKLKQVAELIEYNTI